MKDIATWEIVPGCDHAAEIVELFDEYTRMLVEAAPGFAKYLEIQDYDAEIRDLTQKYGGERGRLYLALADGKPAGCIALHPLDEVRCEMKRLYVRPAYRRSGLGRQLAELILRDAEEAGFREILLDTLPQLEAALKMYRDLGFEEIPSYNDSPLAESIYMKKTLWD